ncbi:mitochondrial translation initiation factor [Grosmannia clavigera kw1407]|uniref:Translation initiation factor IF-2, mitochondrial n=1 Tax=Grosmannia clavigera (strain kw1407 / UAMH 11150) TaxID=655863 RepID=F0XEH6_GROCL|nr:mitochondrial translation initiation factor [Grosmannia clavigera kw1407]EFX04229.1 mitochondrial translation initiation factor [Grosmannia clavigera kw1407]
MIRGHLWRDPQRRSIAIAASLPSCRLSTRIPTTAATVRWQSQDRPKPFQPFQPFQPIQTTASRQNLPDGPPANRPFGGGLPPSRTNRPPTREWGKLQQRSGPRRGKTPHQGGGASDGSPLQQLARDMTKPSRPKASMLGFEPIRKARGGGPPGRDRNEQRRPDDFLAAFGARDSPSSVSRTARARTPKADRRDRDSGGSSSNDIAANLTADGWDDEKIELELQSEFSDVPLLFGEGPLLTDGPPTSAYEHHRKGRKEKVVAAEKTGRTKAKSRRRSSYAPDEDDEYDEMTERAEERRQRKEEKRRQREMGAAAARQGPIPILLPAFISVANLGTALRVRPHVFLQQLAELGFDDITLDNIMTGETAALVAQEYGFEPTVDLGEAVDLRRQPAAAEPSKLPERPPVVTIMGHVDHGKTTMLDWLRKSSVAAQEHGGITQHIGAFSVELSGGKQITFLDTPGHAAFLTMRQRGALVTDIVILVVAADDSVKPQTLEALKHARAARVPIIVAINKVDKDEARIDQVKSDLARYGVELEDYGGDVQVVCVSGRTGQGMADLEESILTQAEMLDVRAERDGLAEGWVLESSVKDRVGRAASVLVRRGTLRRGDVIVAGITWARVRVLRNEAGVEIDEAPPGTPVEVLGWKELPDAGDEVLQAPTETRAKEATAYRLEARERGQAAATEQERQASEVARVEEKERAENIKSEKSEKSEIAETEAETAGPSTVNFVVKADVMGSVEAVVAAVLEIGSHEVRPQVLRAAPGPVTESDVEHAATTGSAIISFHGGTVQGTIRRMAKDAGVPLLEHSVIYHLIDEVRDRLSARLAPTVTTRVLGEAEVLQVFPINVRGRLFRNVAGCRVRNGLVTRSGRYRVLRGKEVIFDGKLESLKQGKKDASEMRKGTECGISFDGWGDFAAGDTIQAYEEIREKRTL